MQSHNATYSPSVIEAEYRHSVNRTEVAEDGTLRVRPETQTIYFKTGTAARRTGLLIVGLGGNNATTLVGGLLANKHNLMWPTKRGVQVPNMYGSLTQAATVKVGTAQVPFGDIVPMLNPTGLVVSGWDINGANLYDATRRSEVFDVALQDHLRPYLEPLVPMPSIYYPDFIASNQADRADNVVVGQHRKNDLSTLRCDISEFKRRHDLETVVVVWSANTEKNSAASFDTEAEVLAAIDANCPDVAPSLLFATAAVLEGCAFLNTSPQNTLHPGLLAMARRYGVLVAGDDLKTGQTKLKSVMVDFLLDAGIKPESVVSYNHLGNNDGKNLDEQAQFKAKEQSKSRLLTEMVTQNPILFPAGTPLPDHRVVIKYVPSVGDTKTALDEYKCRIFMNGQQTFTVNNVCEDSLLAAPLILDLVVLAELFGRVHSRDNRANLWRPIAPTLGYMFKAPVQKAGDVDVTYSLALQRQRITALLLALVGLNNEPCFSM